MSELHQHLREGGIAEPILAKHKKRFWRGMTADLIIEHPQLEVCFQ